MDYQFEEIVTDMADEFSIYHESSFLPRTFSAMVEEILEEFPTLTEQQVRDIIAFAARSTEEDLSFGIAYCRCFDQNPLRAGKKNLLF